MTSDAEIVPGSSGGTTNEKRLPINGLLSVNPFEDSDAAEQAIAEAGETVEDEGPRPRELGARDPSSQLLGPSSRAHIHYG